MSIFLICSTNYIFSRGRLLISNMLFGASFIFPNAYACLMTPFAKTAGMAGAITAFLQILGGVITSGIIAHLPDNSAFPMGVTIVGFAILVYVAFKFCQIRG